jgi:alanine racemase
MIRAFFRKLRKRRFPYEPLVGIEIFGENILHNLSVCAALAPKCAIAPVLKSNAYGHGLVHVAHLLDERSSVSFFIVDSYHEALIIRNEGIMTPLLIVGYTHTENILNNTLPDLSFTIASLSQLVDVLPRLTTQTLHLKFDTGMHRQGMMLSEVTDVFALLAKYPHVNIEGICSHLGDADNDDDTFSYLQISRWNALVKQWKKRTPPVKYFHISPTEGIRFAYDTDANIIRLGIGLYGISTHVKNLKPSLKMVTRITALKTIEAGESVGYGNTFTATRTTRIATIPVGYNEGVDRRLSNKGKMMIGDVVCPIIGRVSMNITILDVTDARGVQEGDEVTVISAESSDPNSVANIAKLCNTIPYDILVHVVSSVRRTVV